jgi:hypothetical protein
VHRSRKKPEQFCFQKSKSDKTDKNFAVPAIEFSSGGDEWEKQALINFIVQHGQMPPFRSEKNCVGTRALRIAGPGGQIH